MRERSSQPLAASCGNSRIGNGPLALPPEYISSAMKKMSPISSVSSSAGSGMSSDSRWIHRKDSNPKTKYRPVAVRNAFGSPTPATVQVEEQRDADEQRAADGPIDADDPEDAPPGLVDRCRQRSLLERRDRGLGLGIHGQRLAHWPSAQANPSSHRACLGARQEHAAVHAADHRVAGIDRLARAPPHDAARDCCAC